MARSLLFFFILADAFVVFTMADLSSVSPCPSSTPVAHSAKLTTIQETTNRKFGRYQTGLEMTFEGPSVSLSRAPGWSEASSSDQLQPSPVEQEVRLAKQHRHSSADKSVAGGGVILGCLATTFLVVVFCYIRATGRHKSEAATNAADGA